MHLIIMQRKSLLSILMLLNLIDPNKFGYQRKLNPFMFIGQGMGYEGHLNFEQQILKSYDK